MLWRDVPPLRLNRAARTLRQPRARHEKAMENMP
jgi:hypothetical protein